MRNSTPQNGFQVHTHARMERPQKLRARTEQTVSSCGLRYMMTPRPERPPCMVDKCSTYTSLPQVTNKLRDGLMINARSITNVTQLPKPMRRQNIIPWSISAPLFLGMIPPNVPGQAMRAEHRSQKAVQNTNRTRRCSDGKLSIRTSRLG